MAEQTFPYIIIGNGLAGASAVEGIRERDKTGPILLIGSEMHLPYDRPPLTKKLWFGKKKVEELFPYARRLPEDTAGIVRRKIRRRHWRGLHRLGNRRRAYDQ